MAEGYLKVVLLLIFAHNLELAPVRAFSLLASHVGAALSLLKEAVEIQTELKVCSL